MKMKPILITCGVIGAAYVGLRVACEYNEKLNRECEARKKAAEERLAKAKADLAAAKKEADEISTLFNTLKEIEKQNKQPDPDATKAAEAMKEVLDLFGDAMTASERHSYEDQI